MLSSEYKEDRKIAKQLYRTWDAFFARHGRLTNIQRETIPHLLNGENVTIVSATATGKTEAAVAPLIERFSAGERAWTILFVCPTRALVNDLYWRLMRPMEMLDLKLARRTGDHKSQLNPSPHLIITTPESFDSLMCRGRLDQDYHALQDVRAVVLDEVHLLYGTGRGEMIRWLMERLRRFKRHLARKGSIDDDKVVTATLSATVGDVEGLSDFFSTNAFIVKVQGGRPIEEVLDTSEPHTVEEALPEYISKLESPEKMLVFCNSRRRVDHLSQTMQQSLNHFGYQVYAHHGSLGTKIREATETALKNESRIVVFTTSTLELGIDIGDIDLVVLDAPALDVCSFLQRVGRGNRRTQKTRVLMCSCNKFEYLTSKALLTAAREGRLNTRSPGPNYAVAVQQIASYIFQRPNKRYRSPQTLSELIDSCCPALLNADLLGHLVLEDELEKTDEGYRLGEIWRERIEMGQIHSVIESAPGHSVVDTSSGKTIATGISYKGENNLSIGGQAYTVKQSGRYSVEASPGKSGLQGNVSYAGNRSLANVDQPLAVRRLLNLSENIWPVLSISNLFYVFHLGGTTMQAVLKLLAKQMDEKVSVNKWFLSLANTEEMEDKPEWLQDIKASLLHQGLHNDLKSLERMLGRPFANRRLPTNIRIEEIKGWLQIDEEKKAIEDSIWLPISDASLSTALKHILDGMQK